MKKQFLAEFILILVVLVSFISCNTVSDSDRNEIVSSAILLADRYCSKGDYQAAIEVYEKANKQCKDWRFLYNKIVILEFLGKHSETSALCLEGYDTFGKTEFLVLRQTNAQNLNLLEEVYDSLIRLSKADKDNKTHIYDALKVLMEFAPEKAYSEALTYWTNGLHTKELVAILYSLNQEEWEVVNKVLGN